MGNIVYDYQCFGGAFKFKFKFMRLIFIIFYVFFFFLIEVSGTKLHFSFAIFLVSPTVNVHIDDHLTDSADRLSL